MFYRVCIILFISGNSLNYIYFSGHGLQEEEQEGQQLDGCGEQSAAAGGVQHHRGVDRAEVRGL